MEQRVAEREWRVDFHAVKNRKIQVLGTGPKAVCVPSFFAGKVEQADAYNSININDVEINSSRARLQN